MQTVEPRLNEHQAGEAPRLTSEDVVPGKAWVHPDTRLEYADWAAYFAGKDPLPHWRNAQIKSLQWVFGVNDARASRRIELLCRDYDRQGQPVTEEAEALFDRYSGIVARTYQYL